MFFQLYRETAGWQLDSEPGQHPGALVQVRAGIPAAMGNTMLTTANPMAHSRERRNRRRIRGSRKSSRIQRITSRQ